jgi:transposase
VDYLDDNLKSIIMEKTKEIAEYVKYQKKLVTLKYAKEFGVNKFLKDFKIPKSTYYKWKKAFDKQGAQGLLMNTRSQTVIQIKLARRL